jgi:hypothetical protein
MMNLSIDFDALDRQGWAIIPALMNAQDCAAMAALYDQADGFRSEVIMARHGFGRGRYKYFSYPLPDPVQALRQALYPPLAGLANDWARRMGMPANYPPDHESYRMACHQAGQVRPTPLLLRYGPGDYNCLHQDLYGAQVFPMQVAILLSAPGVDFTGGSFVITEQRPRAQSRPHVVPLTQGCGVVFAVSHRPVQGTKGTYRVNLRHGVSEITSGKRHCLGLIFHDAA